MRIFIHSPGIPVEDTACRAIDILHQAEVYDIEAGGTVSDRAVILVEERNVPKVIAALTKAGIEAITE